jgi:hypothetical protein
MLEALLSMPCQTAAIGSVYLDRGKKTDVDIGMRLSQ